MVGIQSAKRTNDNSPAIRSLGSDRQRPIVREAGHQVSNEWKASTCIGFSRPLHGLPVHSALLCAPAMNRWAIVIRPLRGLDKHAFCTAQTSLPTAFVAEYHSFPSSRTRLPNLTFARSLSSSPPPEKDGKLARAGARNISCTRGFYPPIVCLRWCESSPRNSFDAGRTQSFRR